ncbi:DUF262 domain-containing protein [Halomonas sp. DP8Y7-3]|uniref:GmrSD restriction endonuclease domain-containing protein n=1 Tax=Halomonas sp. DP8Y7-3 TaxID=2859079 RepID=UPI001C962BB8|nr:DUF262 domain-containing protein [Halomonas sp. DP8Y7-3]MBY5928218.1 DUF262 domain-containing protein [Halomonas sp. DP8Y7-3]
MSDRVHDIQAQMQPLGWFLSHIKNGEMALPDFQRDFDWADGDVISLLSTVLLGWPAGSLLIIENGANSFLKTRNFEEGPAVSNVNYIVLDGQQRLTSLFHAICGVGPSVFAIDWKKALDTDIDFEESIISFKREQWNKNYSSASKQGHNHLIPISALSSPSDFFEWRDNVLSLMDANEATNSKNELTTIYRERLGTLHEYRFPVVLLNHKLEPAAVARIFERVNRTGMKLSSFDLMVAKLYKENWNLRQLWEAAKNSKENLENFLGDDGLPILQAIALYYNEDIRQSSVLKLQPRVVHKSWENAVDSVDAALNFLSTECGVLGKDFLPYRSMIVPLAALAMDHNLYTYKSTITRWFWACSLGQAFDVAANTRLVSWYKELKLHLTGAHTGTDTIDWPKISIDVLKEANKKSGKAVWCGIICSLALSVRKSHTSLKDAFGENLDGSLDVEAVPFLDGTSPVSVQTPPLHLRGINMVLLPRDEARTLKRGKREDILLSSKKVIEVQFIHDLNEQPRTAEETDSFLESRIRKIEMFLREETDGQVYFSKSMLEE